MAYYLNRTLLDFLLTLHSYIASLHSGGKMGTNKLFWGTRQSVGDYQ